jgi:hypothetical protein
MQALMQEPSTVENVTAASLEIRQSPWCTVVTTPRSSSGGNEVDGTI